MENKLLLKIYEKYITLLDVMLNDMSGTEIKDVQDWLDNLNREVDKQ